MLHCYMLEKLALHWKGYTIFKNTELHYKLLTKKDNCNKAKKYKYY